jgi:hypothetical protein
MGQLGFFDVDKRLAALSAKGDPLEAIDRLVPACTTNPAGNLLRNMAPERRVICFRNPISRSNGSRGIAASGRRKRCAAASCVCWPSHRKTIALASRLNHCFPSTSRVTGQVAYMRWRESVLANLLQLRKNVRCKDKFGCRQILPKMT